uniref:LysR_substrate domain-containing protein n=1 Tax=Echinococcus granulosus TaxID=6210 RepID=A0A068WCH8_ECHGR|nr:hypothetical protein EgrG_002015800 [Echinococcus granulosus]
MPLRLVIHQQAQRFAIASGLDVLPLQATLFPTDEQMSPKIFAALKSSQTGSLEDTSSITSIRSKPYLMMRYGRKTMDR